MIDGTFLIMCIAAVGAALVLIFLIYYTIKYIIEFKNTRDLYTLVSVSFIMVAMFGIMALKVPFLILIW